MFNKPSPELLAKYATKQKCIYCGTEFKPTIKKQLACSTSCKPKPQKVVKSKPVPIEEPTIQEEKIERPKYKPPYLAAQKHEKEKRKFNINSFDIETVGFSGELKMCGYAMENGETGIFSTGEQFAYFLLNGVENRLEGFTKARWYAHNMGFDLTRLITPIKDVFKDYVLSVIESGLGNIISISLQHKEEKDFRLQMVDSTAFIGKRSLESIAPQFGFEKLVGSIDFEGGEIPDITNPKHVEYCIRDCTILRDIMIKADSITYENFGVHVRITAASTALQAWIRTIEPNKKYSRLSKEFEKFARLCYYGGYVTVGKDAYKVQKATLPNFIPYVDAGSMYPFVMRKYGVPSGTPTKTTSYKKGDIGFYYGTVSGLTPDKINCVPFRTKHGLIFPHTKQNESFKTYLSSVDIENLTTDGALFECDYGYRFDEVEYPFAEIVTICENLRIKYKKTVIEMIAKLIQNSLYGKFGMKEEGRSYIYTKLNEIPEGYFPDVIESSEEFDSEYVRAFADELRDEHYMLPHWAAFITANARKHLHDFIRVAGFENLLYSDTDSATFKPAALPKIVSHPLYGKDEYGKFKVEHQCSEFRSLGAKVYGFKEGEEYSGACKGIPKKVIKKFHGEFFKELIHNSDELGKRLSTLTYETIRSLDSVLKGNELVGLAHRSLSDIRNSIKFNLNEEKEVIITQIGNDSTYHEN